MTERVTIPMTSEMMKALVKEAHARQMPVAELIRWMLKGYLGPETGEAA
jgi:hypothetical protein